MADYPQGRGQKGEIMEHRSRSSIENEWTEKFMKTGKVSFETAGRLALFADPVTSTGGEKISMEIPSYEALKGFIKNIFFKPALTWYVDRVRVMNPIRMHAEGQLLLGYRGEKDRAYFTYLEDVRYQVEAHFEFNPHHPEFSAQWTNDAKYYHEFVRAVIAEGRYNPFFGKSECVPDYIRLCDFGEGAGYYDNKGYKDFGCLYHGITYPDEAYDEATEGHITINMYHAYMVNGIVEYPPAPQCLHRTMGKAKIKRFPDKPKEEEVL